jgi:hypothetical protein
VHICSAELSNVKPLAQCFINSKVGAKRLIVRQSENFILFFKINTFYKCLNLIYDDV